MIQFNIGVFVCIIHCNCCITCYEWYISWCLYQTLVQNYKDYMQQDLHNLNRISKWSIHLILKELHWLLLKSAREVKMLVNVALMNKQSRNTMLHCHRPPLLSPDSVPDSVGRAAIQSESRLFLWAAALVLTKQNATHGLMLCSHSCFKGNQRTLLERIWILFSYFCQQSCFPPAFCFFLYAIMWMWMCVREKVWSIDRCHLGLNSW